MKKIKILSVALIGAFVTIVGFYSCEKTYVEPISPTKIIEKPMIVIAPAMWRISSFQWLDKSDNDHFIDYTFQFNTDATITAIHNNIKESGKWSKRNDILEIGFGSKPLYELSNNWTIVSHSVNSIELRGLSPIDNSSEFLILEKISSVVAENK